MTFGDGASGAVTGAGSALNSIYIRTFGKMAAALVVAAVVAGLGASAGFVLGVFPMLVGLLVVIGVNVWVSRRLATLPPAAVYAFLFGEAIYIGLMLSGVLQVYSPGAVFVAFVTAALFFAGLVIAGWVTRRDLSRLGNICVVGVFVLIVVELVLLFIHAPLLWMLCAAVSLVLFAGITARDSQMVRNLSSDGSVVTENVSTMCALSLFLDFVNIFLDILQLIGGSGRN